VQQYFQLSLTWFATLITKFEKILRAQVTYFTDVIDLTKYFRIIFRWKEVTFMQTKTLPQYEILFFLNYAATDFLKKTVVYRFLNENSPSENNDARTVHSVQTVQTVQTVQMGLKNWVLGFSLFLSWVFSVHGRDEDCIYLSISWFIFKSFNTFTNKLYFTECSRLLWWYWSAVSTRLLQILAGCLVGKMKILWCLQMVKLFAPILLDQCFAPVIYHALTIQISLMLLGALPMEELKL
jgi:hypothetical protein